MYFKIILNNILNKSISSVDRIITGTTTSDQSGPRSNGNEEVALHSSDL